jgi:GNAT superfamily N-acetyltransferase
VIDLNLLAIRPFIQNRGIGSGLLSKVIGKAEYLKYGLIVQADLKAVKFYKASAFRTPTPNEKRRYAKIIPAFDKVELLIHNGGMDSPL